MVQLEPEASVGIHDTDLDVALRHTHYPFGVSLSANRLVAAIVREITNLALDLNQ